MLALTIFCVVAVALTTALQQTVDTAIILRDESQVRLEIQNLLDETSAMKLKPGKSEVQMGDGRVRYEREVRAVQAKTAKGVVLPSLYEIKFKLLGDRLVRIGPTVRLSLFINHEKKTEFRNGRLLRLLAPGGALGPCDSEYRRGHGFSNHSDDVASDFRNQLSPDATAKSGWNL